MPSQVTVPSLLCRDTLLVVSTVFTILSGQGEALNIDPASFYVHLYNSLFQIEAVRCSSRRIAFFRIINREHRCTGLSI
jgi:hypothetical protein